MPIPNNGKKVIYLGSPYYWFDDKRKSNWNIFAGAKGILIKAPKLSIEIHNKTHCFYPKKWNGFCFLVNESETKEDINSQLELFTH